MLLAASPRQTDPDAAAAPQLIATIEPGILVEGVGVAAAEVAADGSIEGVAVGLGVGVGAAVQAAARTAIATRRLATADGR